MPTISRVYEIYFFLPLLFIFSISIRKILAVRLPNNKNSQCDLIIQRSINLNSIKEFNMSRNGTFSFLLKEYQSLVIEVKSNGYIVKALQ
jgi:hypothetical protein